MKIKGLRNYKIQFLLSNFNNYYNKNPRNYKNLKIYRIL